ncbi:MAG: DUF2953 domain-containing protein [Lachnospiraceae bacterium]|jgi:hypothetical protein|nr:DUF2953 domain-containing protein [Lachnospiraceae bacterium]
MLHIILTILKILGVLLLCLFILLFLFLLLALFVPVKYRIKGIKGEEVEGKILISWLFYILCFRLEYKSTRKKMELLLFGIPFKISGKKKKRKSEKKEEKEIPVEQDSLSSIKEEEESKKEFDNEKTEEKEEETHSSHMEKKEEEIPLIHDFDPDAKDMGHKKKKKCSIILIFKKIGKMMDTFIQNFFQFFKKIGYTFSTLCDRIKAIKDQWEYYTGIFSDEKNIQIINNCLGQVKKGIGHIMPRKCKGFLRIGMEDPAWTGRILSILGVLYPLYGEKIKIIPEFEQRVFEGEILLAGRIRTVVLLRIGLKLYFNRELKQLMKALKKEEA